MRRINLLNMNKYKIVLVLLVTFGFNLPLQAKDLMDYLGHVKSLTANFNQFVFNETIQEPDKSKGTIAVISPDKFRLEYNSPYKQIYVADGVRLWSYDEDLEQVTVKKQQGLLANSPAIILGNPAKIEKAYVIKHQGVTQDIDWFFMTPKDPDSQFDHIRLGFSGDQLYIMEMFDSFGQRTQLRFSQLKYNPDLSHAHFTFKVPVGVDVIGDVPQ